MTSTHPPLPPPDSPVTVTFHEGFAGHGVDLPELEVQVWQSRVPLEPEWHDQLAGHLTPEELGRAGKIVLAGPRRDFAFGRGWLRYLLGSCLAIDPGSLVFHELPGGKPGLRPSGANRDLRFNLSHSGGRVVIALARGRAVGVDLEWIHGLEDWNSLSARIFSPRELAELHALPLAQQRLAFFNGWTRKEAWLKATGHGLSDDLSAIEVTLTPGEPPKWLALPGGSPTMRRWAIREVPLPPEFTGAMVYESTKPLVEQGVLSGGRTRN